MVDVSTFEDPIDVKLAIYAATLTRSMCRSTFEDPIGVNFIIMLLYSCTRITPRVCTLVLFIIIAFINPRYACAERVTVVVSCVCVCLSVCMYGLYVCMSVRTRYSGSTRN